MRENKNGIWGRVVLFLLLLIFMTAEPGIPVQGANKTIENKDFQWCSMESNRNAVQDKSKLERDRGFEVHVLDVGQGLSVLIKADGKYLLYDGGDREYSSRVIAYLKKQKVKNLDYMIASHYDSDHLNGLAAALHEVKVKHVIGPDYHRDTASYEAFVKAVKSENLSVDHPEVGDEYHLGSSSFTILAPEKDRYGDENDYSVAIRLEYGDNSMVITGDATKVSEYEMVESGEDLKSDLLVLGHHGSSGSTSLRFLKEVAPEAAIISCEEENHFQHPYKRVMRRLKRNDIEVFRTDKQGGFVLASDGRSWSSSEEPCNDYSYGKPPKNTPTPLQTGKGAGHDSYDISRQQKAEDRYVLNYNSMKFHKPSCRFVKKISPANYGTTNKEKMKLELDGFSPCGHCRP